MITTIFPNAAQILSKLKGYQAGVVIRGQMVVNKLADDIADTARDLAPVDTGKLRDSIRKEQRGQDVVVVVDRGGDKPAVPIYLEVGTYKMAARPFLRPAVDLVMASGGARRAAAEVGGLLPPV